MTYIIVGLGNPGEEYENTRHNTGRIILEKIKKNFDLDEWDIDKKSGSQTSKGEIDGEKVLLMMPETFMNKSGGALKNLITNKKKAESLIVIHDDLDIPLGKSKMTFNRGSGGHRGVESIIRAIKTEGFIRIKVGISPATPSGKIKKPSGEEAVTKLILGKFKPAELDTLKKISKKVNLAIETLISHSLSKSMTEFNQS